MLLMISEATEVRDMERRDTNPKDESFFYQMDTYKSCLDLIYFYRNKNAMKLLPLRLDDEVFGETVYLAAKLEMNRNRYINEAILLYNKLNRRKMLKSQLAVEVELARDSSMKILEEFEAFEASAGV